MIDPIKETKMDKKKVVVLKGDETGQELLEESLRVLQPEVIGTQELEFEYFDLSLENRRLTHNQVVRDAADRLKETGLGIKAATITPSNPDDVGSPNALLREWINGQVILRTGRRIPGVRPLAGVHAPIAVVRMAVEDAYNAKEWREGQGEDEIAYSTRYISRRTCRAVSEFTFRYARRTNSTVFGGPKYTVSPVYEGMLKEEMDAAAKRYPDVRYNPQLIDATFALLLDTTGEPLVIPSLNRDGDILSDLVIKMFGTIAGAESVIFSLDESNDVKVVLTEAPHGTAPSLYGKNVANPMAMILAGAALLRYVRTVATAAASRAIYESVMEAVNSGIRTSDLGGSYSTTAFTDEIIRRVQDKLEIWATLGETPRIAH